MAPYYLCQYHIACAHVQITPSDSDLALGLLLTSEIDSVWGWERDRRREIDSIALHSPE